MPDFDLGRAKGRIEIDTTDLDKLKSKASSTAALMSSKFKAVGETFRHTGKQLTVGLTLPIIALGVAVVKAFSDSQVVIAQTKAVIKSTGGVAHVSAKHVAELAKSIELVTGFSDEQVAAGENMLLSFKRIRNEVGKGNDIFDQATGVVANYSRFFGVDLPSAAIKVGKALNDPIKGITALTRVGVTFTEQQKAQIKAFEESGRHMDAQKIIIRELNSEFGGSAKAFGKTAAGQFEIAKNAINDSMEQIGQAVVKVAGPIMQMLADGIQKALKWFNNLSPHMKNLILLGIGLTAALGPLVFIIGTLATAIGFLVTPVGAAIAVLAALAWIFRKQLVVGIQEAYKWLKANFTPMVATLKDVLSGFMDILRTLWRHLKGPFLEVWKTIKKVWSEDLQPALKDLGKSFESLKPLLKAIAIIIGVSLVLAVKFWLKQLVAWLTMMGLFIRAVAWAIRILSTFVRWVGHIALGAFRAFIKAMHSVKNATIAVWNAVKGAVITSIHGMQKAFNSVKRFFIEGWHAIKRVAVGIWDGIKSAALAAFNWLKQYVISPIITGINKVIGGINAISPVNLPTIPPLARGTKNFKGGLALVGEAGPEIAFLPKGTAVIPNSHLRQLAAKSAPRVRVEGGQPSLAGMRVVGTLQTSWGPADIEGMIEDGIIEDAKFRTGLGRMGRAG